MNSGHEFSEDDSVEVVRQVKRIRIKLNDNDQRIDDEVRWVKEHENFDAPDRSSPEFQMFLLRNAWAAAKRLITHQERVEVRNRVAKKRRSFRASDERDGLIDDAVQDAIEYLQDKKWIPKDPNVSRFGAFHTKWVRKSVDRLVEFARARKQREILLSLIVTGVTDDEGDPCPYDPVDTREDRDSCHQAVEKEQANICTAIVKEMQSSRSRAILEMHYYEQMSHKQIANRLNMKVAAVRKAFERAKKEFRTELNRNGLNIENLS